jgi:hypothetical protein
VQQRRGAERKPSGATSQLTLRNQPQLAVERGE